MIFTPQHLVHVYHHSAGPKKLMGRLLLKNRQIFFEYDAAFIKTGLELSPFKLPLKPGVISSADRTFEGLWGVFNDSLPDGWGRLLLDRKLMSLGINPGSLSPLDRLCFVGSHGMGALSYEPETPAMPESLSTDLDAIDHEIQATLEENDTYVDDLLVLGGSSVGARPKVLLRMANEDWLIKFQSTFDLKDMGAMEYAYHLMAKKAGLHLPEARLFPSRQGPGFFGVRRFDREGNKRIHMHTMAGLLHADHREPSLDYETIMKVTLHLTQDVRECEALLRQVVFNILSHNRDDHSKNFSFLMDKKGAWSVSPAYDLTFSSGPSGEHSTMVMGEGKRPTQGHFLRLAEIASIEKDKALEMIEQVFEATQQWQDFATKTGVSTPQKKYIRKILDRTSKEFMHS